MTTPSYYDNDPHVKLGETTAKVVKPVLNALGDASVILAGVTAGAKIATSTSLPPTAKVGLALSVTGGALAIKKAGEAYNSSISNSSKTGSVSSGTAGENSNSAGSSSGEGKNSSSNQISKSEVSSDSINTNSQSDLSNINMESDGSINESNGYGFNIGEDNILVNTLQDNVMVLFNNNTESNLFIFSPNEPNLIIYYFLNGNSVEILLSSIFILIFIIFFFTIILSLNLIALFMTYHNITFNFLNSILPESILLFLNDKLKKFMNKTNKYYIFNIIIVLVSMIIFECAAVYFLYGFIANLELFCTNYLDLIKK